MVGAVLIGATVLSIALSSLVFFVFVSGFSTD